MKTFIRLIVITSSILITSCIQNATQEHTTIQEHTTTTREHNIKEVNIDSIKEEEEEITKTLDQKFSCSENSTANLNSQIICKTTDLEKLKNNYQLTYKEKKTFENSKLYIRIKKFEKKIEYKDKIDNLNYLSDMVSEVNVCYAKGTVDLGKKLYARASIEEIIFKSEDCASQFIKTLNEIFGDNMYLKELFNKSPHSIFNDKNRVYYISSGGFYMAGFVQEIENSIKNKSCY